MNKVTLTQETTILGNQFSKRGINLTPAELLAIMEQLESVQSRKNVFVGNSTNTLGTNKRLDELQTKVTKSYGHGDFASMSTYSDVLTCEDTLLKFIILELHDAKGNVEEGARLIRSAALQLEEIANNLEGN